MQKSSLSNLAHAYSHASGPGIQKHSSNGEQQLMTYSILKL